MKELLPDNWFYIGWCNCDGGSDKYNNNEFPNVEIRLPKKGGFKIRHFDKTKHQGDHNNFNMIYEHFIASIPTVN